MSVGITVRDFHGTNATWDHWLEGRGSIFHSSRWLALLETHQAARIRRLELLRDGVTIGLIPVFIQRFFPLKVAASPMVVEDTPYLGLVAPPEQVIPGLMAVREFLKRQGVHFLRVVQREHLNPGSEIPECRFIEKHTHVLDLLPSEDALWKGLEGRCRTAVRKAEKSNVIVQLGTQSRAIEDFYPILDALYGAQGMRTPNSRTFYEALWSGFSNRELFHVVASVDGQTVAGALLLQDRESVYYLTGCSRPEFNALNPSNLVQWFAICEAKRRGALRYDFVGSDIERLAKFKASFGGTVVRHTLVESASSSWVRVVREQYPRLKQLSGRMLRSLNRTNSSENQ